MNDLEKRINEIISELEKRHEIKIRLAIEYGFRALEKGWNLEKALAEYDKIKELRKKEINQ